MLTFVSSILYYGQHNRSSRFARLFVAARAAVNTGTFDLGLKAFVPFDCQVGDALYVFFCIYMYLFIMVFVRWIRNDTCVPGPTATNLSVWKRLGQMLFCLVPLRTHFSSAWFSTSRNLCIGGIFSSRLLDDLVFVVFLLFFPSVYEFHHYSASLWRTKIVLTGIYFSWKQLKKTC